MRGSCQLSVEISQNIKIIKMYCYEAKTVKNTVEDSLVIHVTDKKLLKWTESQCLSGLDNRQLISEVLGWSGKVSQGTNVS